MTRGCDLGVLLSFAQLGYGSRGAGVRPATGLRPDERATGSLQGTALPHSASPGIKSMV